MSLKRRRYYKIKNGHKVIVYRNNPDYPMWHCFTAVRCEQCGESYEPICEAKHICEKQNSYPYNEDEVNKNDK